ncbi:MAG: FMN-binding protein [Gammaproteobacteria bacterium TMED92]|nr:MAG: FMN-binding protein [Gammaproteobacteria bacterium TMED92]|tara:strand:- start:255 stop:833 length:579 start_codon:yes stop_codon:yes gene_type:complete
MNNSSLGWRGALSLALIAALCGLALVWTNQVTAPQIAAHRQAQARALMSSLLLPRQQQELQSLQQWHDNILSACSDWWLLRLTETGYAGPIDLLAYWQTFTDGQPSQLKLRVLKHLETPGIGDFIDHERDDYLPGKDSLTVTDWQSMDTVTGATITHSALRRAAQSVAQLLDEETRSSFCDSTAQPSTSNQS